MAQMLKVITRSFSSARSLYQSASGCSQELAHRTLDPQQLALLSEQCLLVDEEDRCIGAASKRECHILREGVSPLHRAFSVFLFNSHGELLVQQRSEAKITFPAHFTNTCCSHPLNIPDEKVEEGALGIRRAAQRRLGIELGIPSDQARPQDFTYLTRIIYSSASDTCWGENEVDYILFLRSDVVPQPNDNEVQELKFIKREELGPFLTRLAAVNTPVTPWFKLISQELLPRWWKNLDSLDQMVDHRTIHRLT